MISTCTDPTDRLAPVTIALNHQAQCTARLVLYAIWSGCRTFPDAGRQALAHTLVPALVAPVSP